MRSLEPFLLKQRSTNNKAQFVLRETNVGGSNTERLINHLKSKHRIHVILEWRPQNYSGTGRDPITNCERGNESL